jgi:DNA-binding NarL/FixJ family response regulator
MNESGSRTRVLLADDHRVMLTKVSRLLESTFDVVAAVENGTLAIEAAFKLKPDVVVLDITMPGMTGIEAARQIKADGSSTAIVFLTIQSDPEYLLAASAMGASYVLKRRLHSDLITAIEEAQAGRVFVSPF